MSFGILGLTLLAADVGDLIDAKAYEKAYAMTKPARLEGGGVDRILGMSPSCSMWCALGAPPRGRSVTGCAGWPSPQPLSATPCCGRNCSGVP